MTMNHRCPNRVIRLINKIRHDVDQQEQRGRSDKGEGWVRLFILPEEIPDKYEKEAMIGDRMAAITDDQGWSSQSRDVKTLTLEHHMAAKRIGFAPMFAPLYAVERLKTGLLNGTLPALSFFAKDVLPAITSLREGDRFQLAVHVRARSPILKPDSLLAAGTDQLLRLRDAKIACDALLKLFEVTRPTFLQVLRNIASTELFPIPETLLPFVYLDDATSRPEAEEGADETGELDEIVAWRKALETPFDQIETYHQYVTGLSPFDTHQGVKGLEFPRVAVIISDDEARGFSFSYEKLFGAKPPSADDVNKQRQNVETILDRTRRLLYVTCSRPESSLALILYSQNPAAIKSAAVTRGWFADEEIELLS